MDTKKNGKQVEECIRICIWCCKEMNETKKTKVM